MPFDTRVLYQFRPLTTIMGFLLPSQTVKGRKHKQYPAEWTDLRYIRTLVLSGPLIAHALLYAKQAPIGRKVRYRTPLWEWWWTARFRSTQIRNDHFKAVMNRFIKARIKVRSCDSNAAWVALDSLEDRLRAAVNRLSAAYGAQEAKFEQRRKELSLFKEKARSVYDAHVNGSKHSKQPYGHFDFFEFRMFARGDPTQNGHVEFFEYRIGGRSLSGRRDAAAMMACLLGMRRITMHQRITVTFAHSSEWGVAPLSTRLRTHLRGVWDSWSRTVTTTPLELAQMPGAMHPFDRAAVYGLWLKHMDDRADSALAELAPSAHPTVVPCRAAVEDLKEQLATARETANRELCIDMALVPYK